MARKEASSFSEMPVVRFGEEEGDTFGLGEEFSGYFKGVKQVTTKYGEKNVYTFQTASGDVQVWESAMLKQKMEQINLGTMTYIEYTGVGKKEKGKNPAKLFKIGYDDEDTIKVNAPRVSFQDETQDDEPDAGDDEPAEEEEQEERRPTSTRTNPPPSNKAPAAKADVNSKLANLMKKKPA